MIKQYLDSIVSMVESDDGISNQYVHRKTTVAPLFAIVLLIPALPIIILLLLMVRLTSRGPGIFKQLRVGKNGQTFTMYKIRTMVDHAEDGLGIVWSQKGDRRVTAVGRFIRNLHLDELPQLLNVVRGEMTLIGPRPERPEIVGNLIEKIPGYACRHRVMPGITGLVQINLPPDSDLSSVRKKLYLDLKYIKTANWLLDLRILMATSIRIFGIDGDGCASYSDFTDRFPPTCWMGMDSSTFRIWATKGVPKETDTTTTTSFRLARSSSRMLKSNCKSAWIVSTQIRCLQRQVINRTGNLSAEFYKNRRQSRRRKNDKLHPSHCPLVGPANRPLIIIQSQ